jgi:hypothetical protein
MSDLTARLRPDGLCAVFHFKDGWLLRQPIDCRDIVRAGQGTLTPDEAQFRAYLAQPGAVGVWPTDIGHPPTWLHYALAGIPTPVADPA